MTYKSLFLVLVSILAASQLAAAPLSFPIGDSKPETSSRKPETEPLNRIVASVNDGVVLASELEKREAMVISQLQQQQSQIPEREALRKQVLDRLILENLQLQLADRNGIRVDDATLNNSLRKMAGQNDMSLSEFREVLQDSQAVSLALFGMKLRRKQISIVPYHRAERLVIVGFDGCHAWISGHGKK